MPQGWGGFGAFKGHMLSAVSQVGVKPLEGWSEKKESRSAVEFHYFAQCNVCIADGATIVLVSAVPLRDVQHHLKA